MVLEEFSTHQGDKFEMGVITTRPCGSKWVTIAKHPTKDGRFYITQVRVQPPKRVKKPTKPQPSDIEIFRD